MSLLLLLALLGHAQDDVADSATEENLEGRVPEEIEAFKAAQARFSARMTELEDDTRAFVDLREREEREKLTSGYDSVLETLTAQETDHRALSIERMEAFLLEYPDTEYAAHV